MNTEHVTTYVADINSTEGKEEHVIVWKNGVPHAVEASKAPKSKGKAPAPVLATEEKVAAATKKASKKTTVSASVATKKTRARKAFVPNQDILDKLNAGAKIADLSREYSTTYHEIWKHARHLGMK